MISDAVWNLGGPTSYENIKTSQFYTAERSTTTYGNHAATYNPPTYTTTRSGSNGWVGTYTCKNGTGTITSCSRNGTYCTYGTGGCTGNTNSSYIYTCNPDGVNGGLGGGLSSSISC